MPVWIVRRPPRRLRARRRVFSRTSPITGTLTVAEAADVLSATSALALQASSTLTQAAQTLTATARLALTASSTLTQADQTLTTPAVWLSRPPVSQPKTPRRSRVLLRLASGGR
jgi:hypothetical protein